MANKITFRSRKDTSEFLKTKGIDTSTWSEEKWLLLNKGQAEIHMMALAEAMWDAKNESVPKQLKAGEWHIPFGDTIDYAGQNYYNAAKQFINDDNKDDADALSVKIATAMCARVSYTVVGEEGKEPNYENDIKLHDRLLASGHMSPFEHCARCMSYTEYTETYFGQLEDISEEQDFGMEEKWRKKGKEVLGISGNFIGFTQYRKMIPGENRV